MVTAGIDIASVAGEMLEWYRKEFGFQAAQQEPLGKKAQYGPAIHAVRVLEIHDLITGRASKDLHGFSPRR